MLAPMGDVTKSVFYQEVLAEGQIKGKIEGEIEGEIKGEIKLLEKLMAEGLINKTYFQETIAPLRQQLRELEEG